MSTCDKHIKNPAKGYSPCAGCEVEHLNAKVSRLTQENSRYQERPLQLESWQEVVAERDRYHEALAYIASGKNSNVDSRYVAHAALETE